MYYLYHIPGKKIGVTRDLNTRVTLIQGYGPSEYEVLDQSGDIDYISNKEIELQKSYGYKVDRKLYKNLFKMRINVTEQTTTFPVALADLKTTLDDYVGLTWQHEEYGQFEITETNIPWILQNAKTSMYNNNRCYIYNKAFYEAYFNPKHNPEVKPNGNAQFDLIRNWAAVRGIYEGGNSHTQYVKLQEEAGELAKALLKNDKPEIVDAIGDIVVVLTNLAYLEGLNIEDCIDSAYMEICQRQGKMVNGTFVKDEN
jgi:NTP pyrophosphatase (non-canonical NTP hydrolase)